MTQHIAHPDPAARPEFLVDGCPRCREYVTDMGIHFDPDRFRAFWAKMIAVEWGNTGSYASNYDKELGFILYKVSLAFNRAFGIHPSNLVEVGRAFAPFIEVTDPRD